jgi:alkanesulfonate monooxygenase SsuD/methylene tetrahydromethanopterin reductase-like flavin-dependent oxidoreductase (luciferase family)
MTELPEIGLRLHGGLDPRSCIELARSVETSGFASLWFAENPLQRGVVPTASVCAVMTQRLRIGLGIINVYSHHPTLIAMEFAALDELAEGRARLGIGSGIGRLIERMGFAWQPLAAMRDAIPIVRGMLAGEEVSYRGRVFSVDKARLGFRPRSPQTPIYMAAMGDRSLRLCGRLADGLIVSNMCPVGYTERAVAIANDAAAEAGRAPPAVVQYVPCAARPDREAAGQAAKAAIGEIPQGACPPVRMHRWFRRILAQPNKRNRLAFRGTAGRPALLRASTAHGPQTDAAPAGGAGPHRGRRGNHPAMRRLSFNPQAGWRGIYATVKAKLGQAHNPCLNSFIGHSSGRGPRFWTSLNANSTLTFDDRDAQHSSEDEPAQNRDS